MGDSDGIDNITLCQISVSAVNLRWPIEWYGHGYNRRCNDYCQMPLVVSPSAA